jgi:RHS repeat-associated protein
MSTPLRTYSRGARLVSIEDHLSGKTYIPHFDHQGTVQCLTDRATGAVTDRFASDAWGVQVKRTGTSINRNWYIAQLGYYRQIDRVLDYVRQRWLSPGQGQFVSRDPLRNLQAQSPYAYARNSPSLGVDPSGELTLVENRPWQVGTYRACGSGQADWYWQFDTVAPCAGWIVQRVSYRQEVWGRNSNQSAITTLEYWEAWQGTAGWARLKYQQTNDTFRTVNRTPPSRGHQHIRGNAGYYCGSQIDRDISAWGHQVPMAGPILPSTRTEPAWWGSAVDTEKRAYHALECDWNCLDPNRSWEFTTTCTVKYQ